MTVPEILQYDNGREFKGIIKRELLHPPPKITSYTPHCSFSQS